MEAPEQKGLYNYTISVLQVSRTSTFKRQTDGGGRQQINGKGGSKEDSLN
jgi:hypothetical protein